MCPHDLGVERVPLAPLDAHHHGLLHLGADDRAIEHSAFGRHTYASPLRSISCITVCARAMSCRTCRTARYSERRWLEAEVKDLVSCDPPCNSSRVISRSSCLTTFPPPSRVARRWWAPTAAPPCPASRAVARPPADLKDDAAGLDDGDIASTRPCRYRVGGLAVTGLSGTRIWLPVASSAGR